MTIKNKPPVDLDYAIAFLREEGYGPAADAIELQREQLLQLQRVKEAYGAWGGDQAALNSAEHFFKFYFR